MKWKQALISIADGLHAANAALCAVLLVTVFAVQLVVVVLRYAFALGFLELQNIVTYAFAALVVLSVPLALRLDRHVRVDILRENQSGVTRDRLDLIGLVFLLVPVFGLTLYHALPGVIYSWKILEGSADTGGLPGYFVVKTALPVACGLMIIQAFAMMVGASPPDKDTQSPR